MLVFNGSAIANMQSLSTLGKYTHMLGKIPQSTKGGVEGYYWSPCCDQWLPCGAGLPYSETEAASLCLLGWMMLLFH